MRRRIHIVQGEQAFATEPGVVLSTLLGSCVAVCLHDPVARVGGMNHFLLDEPLHGSKVMPNRALSYGIHAMAALIKGLLERGASCQRLRAHLFGGANIIGGLGSIGDDNAAFARRFMAKAGIDICHADLGGALPRKVAFLPHDGRAHSTIVAPPSADIVRGPAATATIHHVELP